MSYPFITPVCFADHSIQQVTCHVVCHCQMKDVEMQHQYNTEGGQHLHDVICKAVILLRLRWKDDLNLLAELNHLSLILSLLDSRHTSFLPEHLIRTLLLDLIDHQKKICKKNNTSYYFIIRPSSRSPKDAALGCHQDIRFQLVYRI